jgi:hypothetical protein
MEKEFLEKKNICKKMASESLLFGIVSEDLSKFIESVDQLEYNQATKNLLNTVIKFFTQEKNILTTKIALNKKINK